MERNSDSEGETTLNETQKHESEDSDHNTSKASSSVNRSDLTSGITRSRKTSRLSTVNDDSENEKEEEEEEEEEEEKSEKTRSSKTSKKSTVAFDKTPGATTDEDENDEYNSGEEEEEDSDNKSKDSDDSDSDEQSEQHYEESSVGGTARHSSSQKSRSQILGSQLSHDRLSSSHRTPLDQNITLNQTYKENDISTNLSTRYLNKEFPKDFKIQKYVNSKNELVYPVSLKALNQFENDLLTILDMKKETNEEANEVDFEFEVKKLNRLKDFDQLPVSSAYIADTKALYFEMDFSNPYEPRLYEKKKAHKTNQRPDEKTAEGSKSESKQNDLRKAKVITVVLNGPSRPRKAARLLLNKRNTASLDLVLQDTCNALKVEYALIKRLYNLKGKEVKSKLRFCISIFQQTFFSFLTQG